MGSHAAIVLLLTIIASAFGFARELATAAVYATSVDADAFALMLVYVEGVSTFMTYGVASQVLVPLFVRLDSAADHPASEVASGLFAWIACLGVPLIALGWIMPDSVTGIVAPLASLPYREALRPLATVSAPICLLLAAAGVASGVLRARADFYTPVIGRALFSLATAAFVFVLGATWGTRAASVGLLVGAAAQFGIQWWRLRAIGWTWARPRMFDGRFLTLLTSAWPVLLALFVTQLLVFGVQRALTSDLPTGDFATTNYAQRLLGIVSLLTLSVSTVAATDLARHYQEGGLGALTTRMVGHLQALAFVLVPSTVLLMGGSRLLVDLAFHRGSFTDAAALDTALVLRVFSLALVPGGVCTILQLLFTSADRPRLVLVVALPMVAVVWLLTVVLRSTLGSTLLATAFVGGVWAMLAASLAATAWLVGGGPVTAFCRYAAGLIARAGVAAAMGSIVAWSASGGAGASQWLLGQAATGVTLGASVVFVAVFAGLSWWVDDAGSTRLTRVVVGLVPGRRERS